MSKYDGLGEFLKSQKTAEVRMTFADIERVAGVKLPPKAQHHRAWWSNNPSNNVMTHVWLEAGFETAHVDMGGRKLLFRRRVPTPPTPKLTTAPRDVPSPVGESRSVHPLVGALRGTFSIQPGYDLTRPALDPDEMSEMERAIGRKSDLLQQGHRDKTR